MQPNLQEGDVGRSPDKQRAEQIIDYVDRHPGVRPAEIAEHLGVARSAVTRALPALEDQGHLLREDQHGRLWPFRR
jgi:DNA-binding IclR family transcriptional regulator